MNHPMEGQVGDRCDCGARLVSANKVLGKRWLKNAVGQLGDAIKEARRDERRRL